MNRVLTVATASVALVAMTAESALAQEMAPPILLTSQPVQPVQQASLGMPLGYRLITAGSSLFSGMWMTNIFIAATACTKSIGHCDEWPLYIPLVGPLVQMGQKGSDVPLAQVFLGLDALVQFAGVALIVGGSMRQSRDDGARRRTLAISPVGPGGLGLSLGGRF